MSIVQPRTDSAPPLCPTCGSPSTSEQVRIDQGVVTGDYLCGAGHIWRTTWMQGGAA